MGADISLTGIIVSSSSSSSSSSSTSSVGCAKVVDADVNADRPNAGTAGAEKYHVIEAAIA